MVETRNSKRKKKLNEDEAYKKLMAKAATIREYYKCRTGALDMLDGCTYFLENDKTECVKILDNIIKAPEDGGKGKAMLEPGCGNGRLSEIFKQRYEYMDVMEPSMNLCTDAEIAMIKMGSRYRAAYNAKI